jgi:RNA polymerase sigma-70 factor (sigma-E family)
LGQLQRIGRAESLEVMAQEQVPTGYEGFVRERGRALLRYAYLLTDDRSATEDLVQDCLMAAYPRWLDLSEPEAYLRRCIANRVRSRLRRVGLHRKWERLQIDAPTRDPAESISESDALWRAIRLLRPHHRAVLVLRYYEDLPDREIAVILGCSEPTVRSWALRGLSQLRREPPLANTEKKAVESC